jgi:hypothetical protein
MTGDVEICRGGDGSLICVLCAPRATGYSTANSLIRVDPTQFGPSGSSGDLLGLVLHSAASSCCSQQHAEVGLAFLTAVTKQRPNPVARYMGTGVQGYMLSPCNEPEKSTVRHGPRGHSCHLWPKGGLQLAVPLSGQC